MDSFVNVKDLVLNILALIVLLIFIGSLYALGVAIVKFIFFGWNQEKKDSATNSIRYMIVGVLLSLVFLFVFPLLFAKMNITWHENLTAGNVFRRAGDMVRMMFRFGGDFEWSDLEWSSSSDKTDDKPVDKEVYTL